jgi:hypothetical protein
MSELDKFIAVLKEIGVPFQGITKYSEDIREDDGTFVGYSDTCVSVSQAHFHFDVEKQFLCVRDDEMGNVWRRVAKENRVV